MAEGWRYILATSKTMEPIGEFKQAKDRQLKVDNNKSGEASFSSTTDDDTASYIWPWSTCVLAVHAENIYWSGPIVTRDTDMAARRVSVSAVGWFDRLMHLFIQDASITYANQDAGVIVTDLLAKAKVQDPSIPISIGTVQPTQNRTITYTRDQNIGQAIMDLGELESGFDWYVDPVTRELNIVAKRGQDREEVKWIFIGDDKSHQSNLANVVENIDGTTVANEIRPRGRFSSGFADDAVSKEAYGVFQDQPSLSSVVDQNILNAYANAEIVFRAEPRRTYTMTPKSSNKETVPRLFRDFDIGDTTYLTCRRDYISLEDQPVRIFGISLSINNDGSEQITNLQTTADG